MPAARGNLGTDPNGATASDNAATDVYVEHPPAAGGSGGSSSTKAGGTSLEQLLTSPALGAPERIQPLRGGAGESYGTFSFQTLQEVAGVGSARLAALLALLALISLLVGGAALASLSKR